MDKPTTSPNGKPLRPRRIRKKNPGALVIATNTDMTRYEVVRAIRYEMEERDRRERRDADQRECSSAATILLRAQADGMLPGWPTWEQVAAKYPAAQK